MIEIFVLCLASIMYDQTLIRRQRLNNAIITLIIIYVHMKAYSIKRNDN